MTSASPLEVAVCKKVAIATTERSRSGQCGECDRTGSETAT